MFKVGQKVRCIESPCSNYKDEYVDQIVTIEEIEDGKITKIKEWDEFGLDNDWFVPVEKSLYNLQVGDIVLDENGEESMILGVHEGKNTLYHISEDGDFDEFGFNFTAKEMENNDYTIKKVEEEELTMEEVCKELGRNVKIKK